MSQTLDLPKLDLDACNTEPIHIPGGIQPHGVLVVLSGPTLKIVQVSENATTLTHRAVEDLLDQPLERLLGAEITNAFREKLSRLSLDEGASHAGSFRLGDGDDANDFDLIVHKKAGQIVLEFESHRSADSFDLAEFPSRVLHFLAEIEGRHKPDEIGRLTAAEVRRLSGFDRVLIYQFDADWHGQVIAEDRNEKFPSFLGHRFPASDIPAQARELYRVNRSRIIPDADYVPVPLVPSVNAVSGTPLDMTHSTLRSVSPIHVEYMRNMGTAASMSFSILRDGQLWGLISCHNATARTVPYNVRRACELAAQVFSLQLAAAERQAGIEYHISLRQIGSRLLASMTSAEDFIEGLLQNPDDLLAAAAAQGAAVVTETTCRLAGETPDEPFVRRLIAWLSLERSDEAVFFTNHLVNEFPDAEEYRSVASGLLSISASAHHRMYVLWFRPEVVETVTWAGDPRKTTDRANNVGGVNRLNPRTSFESWKQTVRGTASPWVKAEIDAITELHSDVIGIVLRKAEALASLSADLQRSNKELEAFSYSVSHDLRAPFRHIVGFSELLQEQEAQKLSDRGRRWVGTVIESAREAGKLIDNLLAFSQMGRAGITPVPIDMNELAREVRAEVMAAEGANRKVQWKMTDLPPSVADLMMLRLAMRNLLSNAVKYTRDKGDDARVEVTSARTNDEIVYSVRDNGVGFDMRYVDKLFGVFQRLHRVEEFEGTGIGLANVRRIISRHGGRTWAEGRVGEGATFYFALPRSKERDDDAVNGAGT